MSAPERPGGTGRRTFLKVAGAGGAGLLFSSAAGATAGAAHPGSRAYVLVLDGLRPDEVDSGLMPAVRALRDGGRRHPQARSLPIMETIPNHVMMMTGVRPDRNGVPANAVYDRAAAALREMDRPTDIRYPTLLEQLAAIGRTTGTVLSKEYLFGVFGTRATHRWEPAPLVPVSGHAPDAFTMDAALAMVEQFDPDLVFVNLGDVDRLGHSDLSGSTLQAARSAALASADAQVQRFVTMLRDTGRWQRSLVVVLADHSMDWSVPTNLVTLQPVLEADPLLAGRVVIAQNGGADLLYWTGPPAQRDTAVARMLTLVRRQSGVLAAYDRAATPSLRLGPQAGDVVAYCRAGWRFSDPRPVSNPIPGNHGHPATAPIPFFLAGGHPAVRAGTSSPATARTVDVAPTLGTFFGVTAPRGRWDGTSRL